MTDSSEARLRPKTFKPFRWKNCAADVATAKHGITLDLFLKEVIEPTIRALEAKSGSLGQSDNVGDLFEQGDVDAVLSETRRAFGLSVQSIWERQFRSYIRGCAEELRPGSRMAEQAVTAKWNDLARLFYDLRGIKFECFPSFNTLHVLHLVGNVCRHGDGRSARELWKSRPDFWRGTPALTFMSNSETKEAAQDGEPTTESAKSEVSPRSDTLEISVNDLRAFVSAVVEFWADMDYIYSESIERKHSSLVKQLIRERAERRWLPQADWPEVRQKRE